MAGVLNHRGLGLPPSLSAAAVNAVAVGGHHGGPGGGGGGGPAGGVGSRFGDLIEQLKQEHDVLHQELAAYRMEREQYEAKCTFLLRSTRLCFRVIQLSYLSHMPLLVPSETLPPLAAPLGLSASALLCTASCFLAIVFFHPFHDFPPLSVYVLLSWATNITHPPYGTYSPTPSERARIVPAGPDRTRPAAPEDAAIARGGEPAVTTGSDAGGCSGMLL